jgi:peptidoglycan/xylan/chitin deacetylase (PgdA/CDA1 family)
MAAMKAKHYLQILPRGAPTQCLTRAWGALLVAFITCSPGLAQTPAPVEAASAAPESAHTASIRSHRLRHLSDKLNNELTELVEHCRYESDINTPPPPRQVALTFDDGPEPGQTELILATLARHGVRATFFMIGEKAQRHPELVEAVARSGRHLIANHSWDHPNFHSITPAAQAEELRRGEEAVQAHMQKKLFRYPYGNSSCETNKLLKAQDYATVGWHVDSCDWAFDHAGKVDAREAMECEVLAAYRGDYQGHVLSAVRAHNGGIVLMHEIHPNTVKQLDAVIEALKADGFSFGALDDAGFASSLR